MKKENISKKGLDRSASKSQEKVKRVKNLLAIVDSRRKKAKSKDRLAYEILYKKIKEVAHTVPKDLLSEEQDWLSFIKPPGEKLSLDIKTIKAYIQSFRIFNYLTIDVITTTTDELLDLVKSSLLKFINLPQNRKIFSDISGHAAPKTHSASSLKDIDELIDLIEYYMAATMLQQSEKNREIFLTGDTMSVSRIYYSVMALRLIQNIKEKLKKKPDSQSILREVFLLGMCSQEAFNPIKILNNLMTDMHHKLKSSQGRDAGWKLHRELKKEASEMAEKMWSEGDTRYHDEVAKDILGIQRNSYPEIRDSVYFSDEDFKIPYSVKKLCQTINMDKYDRQFKSPDNTVVRLNEYLRVTDLCDWLDEEYEEEELSPDIKQLIGATKNSREEEEKFFELEENEQKKILRLNRLLLESVYPNETPKMPKKDLSRNYTLKVVREAIGDVADKYGRKKGAHRSKR
jgi:hypothetical protein